LSPEELEAVATAFSDLAKVEAQGLRLEKEKFFTVKATADEIQLKRRVSPNTIPPSRNISSADLFQLYF
jgi:hypothetical protein